MSKAIPITRTEHSAADPREFAARRTDGARVRRLLALALILEGCSRAEAAAQSGMDRQTPRDRVHRYNLEGTAGLASRAGPGQPPC
jgi:transposase